MVKDQRHCIRFTFAIRLRNRTEIITSRCLLEKIISSTYIHTYIHTQTTVDILFQIRLRNSTNRCVLDKIIASTYIHTYIHTYTYVHVHTHTYVHKSQWTSVFNTTRNGSEINTNRCVLDKIMASTYMHTHTHTYIHTYTNHSGHPFSIRLRNGRDQYDSEIEVKSTQTDVCLSKP